MKLKLTETQLRMCISVTLNEQATNNQGEPLMSHNQYKEYSEPSDEENDDYIDVKDSFTPNDNQIESLRDYLDKHDIKLESFGENEYLIRAKEKDYLIYPHNDEIEIFVTSSDPTQDEQHMFPNVNEALDYLLKFKRDFLSKDAVDTNIEYDVERREAADNAMENEIYEDASNYPIGATHDSTAPYNQKNSYNDFNENELGEIKIDELNNTNDFHGILITFVNVMGGEADYTLGELLKLVNPGKEIINYFKKGIKMHPRPKDWNNKIKALAEILESEGNIEYIGGREYEEPRADEYYDAYDD